MKTRVKNTAKMGRGVFADKDFDEGDVVEVSQCLKFSKRDTWTIQSMELRMYVFSDDQNGSVLALGNGSLFNHSTRPNVTYSYHKSRNVLIFIATRKIRKGAQLFIDYGYNPVKKRDQWELEQRGRDDAELFAGSNIAKNTEEFLKTMDVHRLAQQLESEG